MTPTTLKMAADAVCSAVVSLGKGKLQACGGSKLYYRKWESHRRKRSSKVRFFIRNYLLVFMQDGTGGVPKRHRSGDIW